MRAVAIPGGAYAVAAEGHDVIDVVPGYPVPAPPGPGVRLWVAGDMTLVQMGAVWPIPEAWLRRNARAAFDATWLTGTSTRLQVAVQGTPTLTVATADRAGDTLRTIAVVTSSGYPPYSTIVNVPADDSAAASFRAAAAGQRGRALVWVTATLPRDLPLDPGVITRTALTIRTPEDSLPVATAQSDLADWAAPERTSQ